ncbi:transthyretin-like family domain-containing protein [Ditylenchus destructor]|uniref:Transthyretin-like family domain-containing protein n=1 Tax=Ditylenchus destructor TaxID=166010 RepID=A0AAD4MZI0_9BILA|nr:transthyretin-like family domain-containing protein [Ditylenchus destructor]
MFPKVFLPVLIALLAYVSCALAFRQQVVGVEGRLMCGSQPLNNTQVKLWSKNKLGTDDQLAHTKTDNHGNFKLDGGVGSLLPLNVHLKRKVDLGVPNEYVERADKVSKYFPAGTMNMEFVFPDEERSCIN